MTTITKPPNDGGQIIISPGQSLIVYLGGFLPVAFDSAIIALG
ncbi:hypothetical protein UT300005_04650 [Clostridium sp. CTA-5]